MQLLQICLVFICGLLSSTLAAIPRTVAIVFTDIKFDDKMAIYVLLKSPIYNHVFAVINGIENTGKAHGDLLDFLDGMPCDRSSDRLTVMKGSNELRSKFAPHEINFIDKSINFDWDYNDIYPLHIKKNDIIHVYQIAPTPRQHIELLSENGLHVTRYHLVHGYNSKQSNNEAINFEWLSTIHEQFKPNTAVIFTNNYASFNPPGTGSSQLYQAIKGRVPERHLESAINDPFFVKKLLEAQEMMSLSNVKLKLIPDGYTEEDLPELFLLARKNEDQFGSDLRKFFLDYIDPVILWFDSSSSNEEWIGRFKKLRASMKAQLQVELCDANHIIEVMTADPTQFVPMQFDLTGPNVKFKFELNHDEKPHVITLKNLRAEDALEKLLKFLP